MKALILAGGKGTRLRPITYAIAKQLVPVANKPVIEYGIEAIAKAGVRHFGVIVGDQAAEIEAAVGDGGRWGIRVTYIPQPAPLGLAHAVATARPFLGDDDFIMYLGDNLIKSNVRTLIEEFERRRPAASILLTRVPNPQDFGVAEMQGERVVRLQEKPQQPKSDLALVGVYLFDRRIHDSIEHLQPSARGEYEITDAIQGLIDAGLDVLPHVIEGWWKDTGSVEAMLSANRLVLDDLAPQVEGSIDAGSTVEGAVAIGAGTAVRASRLVGPVILGPDCTIEDCVIGPYVSIDRGSRLSGVTIEDSIVLAECRLSGLMAPVRRSLIGRGCEVVGAAGSSANEFVLGDSGVVRLP